LCETYAVAYESTRDVAIAAKAEAACSKALSLDASLVEVEMALAHLYVISGRSSRAVDIYRSAVSKNPRNADAHMGLARAYEEQNRTAEAEATYRRAIEAEPGYWGTYNALGGFLMQQGRAKEAVSPYQQAAQLAPTNANALNNLGAALQMTGDLEHAAKAFEHSLALAPTRSAYSNTGSMYYYLGRYPAAAAMFRRATEQGAQDHRVWGNLADALYQIKDKRAEAIHIYRRAIALADGELSVNSNDAVTRAQLGYYYSRIGDLARASRYVAGAIQLRPDIVWVQYYAALVALQTEGRDAALAAVERAIRLGYPAQLVRAAPEFSALHGDPHFADLIASSSGISVQ
jgi:serine/threonine-protein kinase